MPETSTTNPMGTREFLDEDGVNALSARIFEKVNERMNSLNAAENTLSSLAIKFLAMEAFMDLAREHTGDLNNPHQVTMAQLGMERVENKSAADILGELQVVSDQIIGLMTPAMLNKLNSIPDSAMSLVVDMALSGSSENPIANKVVQEAISRIETKIDTDVSSAISEINKKIDNDVGTAINNINQKIDQDVGKAIDDINDKIDNDVGTAISNINQTIDQTKNDLQNAVDNIAQYDMMQHESGDEGFFSTYQMTKDGVPIGAKINIPKDYLVKGVSVKVVATAGVPYAEAVVGDKYVDWVINTMSGTGNEQHLYIPVKDLMNPLSAANAAITITEDNAIGLKCVTANGLSIGANGLQMGVVSATENGAMTSDMLEKLNNAVPNTRKINGVPLNRDLTPTDLGIAPMDAAGKVEVAKLADNATEAAHAATASQADDADHADEADHAATADQATNATNAQNAQNAVNAQQAAEATHAVNADNAANATTAGTANKAGQLTNSRNIAVNGSATGSVAFDGSKDVTITLSDPTLPVLSADPASPKNGQMWIVN